MFSIGMDTSCSGITVVSPSPDDLPASDRYIHPLHICAAGWQLIFSCGTEGKAHHRISYCSSCCRPLGHSFHDINDPWP
jgi:hypothetical protein